MKHDICRTHIPKKLQGSTTFHESRLELMIVTVLRTARSRCLNKRIRDVSQWGRRGGALSSTSSSESDTTENELSVLRTCTTTSICAYRRTAITDLTKRSSGSYSTTSSSTTTTSSTPTTTTTTPCSVSRPYKGKKKKSKQD